jgi:hypothetical protein
MRVDFGRAAAGVMVAAAVFVGCDGGSGEQGSRSGAATQTKAKTTGQGAGASQGVPKPPDDEARAEAMKKKLAKLHDDSALPEDGDYCTTAYGTFKNMLETMSKKTGREAQVPEKKRFVKACSELPEDMQKCLIMRYAMKHPKQCEKMKQNIDPKTLAKVQEIMGPGLGPKKGGGAGGKASGAGSGGSGESTDEGGASSPSDGE